MRPSQEWRQTRHGELQEFERRWFALVGTAEDQFQARPRHSENHEELLRDCECVPRRSADSAATSRRNFSVVAALGGHRRRSMPGQPRHSKKIMKLLRDCECVPRRSGAESATTSAGFLTSLLCAGVGTAEDLIPGQATSSKKYHGSCSVIVNASLEGLRQTTLAELQDFEQRCFALGLATAEDLLRTRPRHSKKIMRSCVIVNASLAGVAPDSACNELRGFRAALFSLGVGTAEINSSQASSDKKNSRSCSVIVNASLAGAARLGFTTSCRNFQRAALVRVGSGQDLLPGQAVTQKIVMLLVIVNASLAGSGARLGLQRGCRNFRATG
jgi:hypothetical protein